MIYKIFVIGVITILNILLFLIIPVDFYHGSPFLICILRNVFSFAEVLLEFLRNWLDKQMAGMMGCLLPKQNVLDTSPQEDQLWAALELRAMFRSQIRLIYWLLFLC